MAITFTTLSSSTVNENTTSTVYTVTVSGASGSITYSISGGADAAHFDINESTGAVTFKNLPNYEAPTDADKNNRYEIIVKADDGTTYAEKAVTIIVKNTVSLYSDWTQLGADIDGEPTFDWSGYSVSLSADGNIVAIGAPYSSDGNGRGDVRVYQYNSNNGWQPLGSEIIGEANDDYSGWSVSLSADGYTVAIGAIWNDSDGKSNRGQVRVYQYNNGWQLLGSEILGVNALDENGRSVSLSANGNIIAISAPYYDSFGKTNRGQVRVYQYNSNNGWQLLGSEILGVNAGDTRGWSVSLSADGYTLAVGSNAYDSGGKTNRGQVCVYKYNSNNGWQLLGSEILGVNSLDENGRSVSLSADGYTVAIGAPYYDGTSTGINDNRGQVRVYQYNNGWQLLGSEILGVNPSDRSGFSVSLSADGNIVAIGSIGYDSGGKSNRGQVRVYQYNNGWQLFGSEILGVNANDEIGRSVSLSADGYTVAIGAPYSTNNTNSGHVRVYTIVKPPQITSGNTTIIAENTTSIAYIVDATHENDTTPLTYSISGGADAALFNINASTGAVTFKNLPNYEAPADVDKDNRYEIIVKASDGSLSSIKTVTMIVTNNISFRYSSLRFSTTEFHSFKPTLFGYIKPTHWKISPKALPPGITINSRTGVISGTATARFDELPVIVYASKDNYTARYSLSIKCE